MKRRLHCLETLLLLLLLVCLLTDRAPLEYASRGRSLRVRPKDGMTWAEVVGQKDLDVTFRDDHTTN